MENRYKVKIMGDCQFSGADPLGALGVSPLHLEESQDATHTVVGSCPVV